MNWRFYDRGAKPKHLEECFAIESRERQIVPCFWDDAKQRFHACHACAEFFHLGPFEDSELPDMQNGNMLCRLEIL